MERLGEAYEEAVAEKTDGGDSGATVIPVSSS
jgi:hypothetical protein